MPFYLHSRWTINEIDWRKKFIKAALYSACEEKNPDSACIRVPRSLDGRMQILNRKGRDLDSLGDTWIIVELELLVFLVVYPYSSHSTFSFR